mgnify:FL=1
MTIEQLLELPPEGLEALSDEQLTQYLSCYFPATRPPEPIQPRIITSAKQSASGTKQPRLSKKVYKNN